MEQHTTRNLIAIAIAADVEWAATKSYFEVNPSEIRNTKYGEYFERQHNDYRLIIYYSGWGKVRSAGAAQYIIDNMRPERITVIGSCAGISKQHKVLDMIFPTKAVEYDCSVKEIEPFINPRFVVKLQPPVPQEKEVVIGTGDRPVILWSDYELLLQNGMDVADMEAAVVAYICEMNNVPCTVIKGISDFPYQTLELLKQQVNVYDDNAKIVTKNIFTWYLNNILK